MKKQKKRIDLSGHRYGKFRVVEYARTHTTKSGSKIAVWRCQCDCGNYAEVYACNLRSGNSKCCGCTRAQSLLKCRTTHGKTKTPEYTVWLNMIARCHNKNHKSYKNYGGRGISVCKRWKSFENFLQDMGERPTGCSLDRIDVDGNYSKDNCRWADGRTQSMNRRIDGTYRGVENPKNGVHQCRVSTKFNGRLYLGVSQNKELLAMRHDRVLILEGDGEFTNRAMGLISSELYESYPCDFKFFNKIERNLTTELKITEG